MESARDFAYDGENISEWFRFDRQVLRQAKKLYGKYGDKLWNGTTMPIDSQSVDSIAQDTYDVILKNDGIREANSNWEWDWFWTVQYQRTWREDALETIVLYVESRCTGKAFKFITELTSDKWPDLRALMQREFARATPAKIKQMEQAFTSGLPSTPGAQAFPPGVDIRAKNYALEQARLTLWLICPDHLRPDYYHGKESTLVRIVINHANSDYMPDLNRVLSMHKLKQELDGAAVPDNMAIESYSDEWLPSWTVVKETLEQTYEALGKDKKQTTTMLPSMNISANARHNKRQPGPCWRCGGPHRMGDDACTNPNGIHESAPEHIRKMHADGIALPAQ